MAEQTSKPKNGSSSPSTAAGSNVYAAAGCIAQSTVGRSAEQLRGTMKLGIPRCSRAPNCRVYVDLFGSLPRQVWWMMRGLPLPRAMSEAIWGNSEITHNEPLPSRHRTRSAVFAITPR